MKTRQEVAKGNLSQFPIGKQSESFCGVNVTRKHIFTMFGDSNPTESPNFY